MRERVREQGPISAFFDVSSRADKVSLHELHGGAIAVRADLLDGVARVGVDADTCRDSGTYNGICGARPCCLSIKSAPAEGGEAAEERSRGGQV